MKKIILILFVISFVGLNSCDYLDVVPEGQATLDDIFKSERDCEKFVHYLYHNLPSRGYWSWMPESFAGGDMITGSKGTTRWYTYKSMLYGEENANNTYFGLWSAEQATPAGRVNYDLFKAIRHAYILLNRIANVPSLKDENNRFWRGEAYWIIAYCHQTLLEMYGPIPIVRNELSLNATEAEMFPMRSSYDDCVAFIADTWDMAAGLLPPTRKDNSLGNNNQIGRATSVSALAFKSRLLLMAASPQFNGNHEDYGDFTNKDGSPLMPLTYDKEKWDRARNATLQAIHLAESNGYMLYSNPSPLPISDFDQGVKNYHDTFCETTWNENEYFFSFAGQTMPQNMVIHSAPRVSLPYVTDGFRNQVSPTFYALEMYYTKNGLPLQVDPLTKDINLFSIIPGDSTVRFHREREPRFYANTGFDRGTYEINGKNITLKMRGGEVHGSTLNTAHEYQSCTGYLNKKFVHSQSFYNPSDKSVTYRQYVFPFIRLAELYFNYAEADFEYNGVLSPESLTFINKVRERCGLPTFQNSWSIVGGIPESQELRNILRQERTIEFIGEGRLYHDSRRWGTAKDVIMAEQKAWNLDGKTQSSFYTLKKMPESGIRNFVHPKNIWLAIPLEQLNVNYNLVQNPGY